MIVDIERTDKLIGLKVQAEQTSNANRIAWNRYINKQAELRKTVRSVIDIEIKELAMKLNVLRGERRRKCRAVYDADAELQRLKGEMKNTQKAMNDAWQSYHSEYEREIQKKEATKP